MAHQRRPRHVPWYLHNTILLPAYSRARLDLALAAEDTRRLLEYSNLSAPSASKPYRGARLNLALVTEDALEP